ncbi:MAG: transposase [Verrucomicrobiales bacterium]|nr:transposase [Verrucomicrobiales bacterium]
MRKTRAFLLGNSEEGNVYHVVSRVHGRNRFFGYEEKDWIKGLIYKQCKFSGVDLLAWCLMDDHFHLVVEVPDQAKALAGMTVDELLSRLAVLSEEHTASVVLDEIQECRDRGDTEKLAQIAKRLQVRLFDLSAFMKELKLKITLYINALRGRRGVLWQGPFKSVLIEPGEALRVMAAYVDLNPLRAGLVDEPGDYSWSSFGAAERGEKLARRGLARAVTGDYSLPWPSARKVYAPLLWGRVKTVEGQKRGQAGVSPDGWEVDDLRGYSRDEIEAVMQLPDGNESLPLPAVLRCRVRYFTDGSVLGSEGFVNRFFESRRDHFGKGRVTGACKMLGARWGDLRSLLDLKKHAVTLPQLDD